MIEVERGDHLGVAYEVEARDTDGGVTWVLLDGDIDKVGRESDD